MLKILVFVHFLFSLQIICINYKMSYVIKDKFLIIIFVYFHQLFRRKKHREDRQLKHMTKVQSFHENIKGK